MLSTPNRAARSVTSSVSVVPSEYHTRGRVSRLGDGDVPLRAPAVGAGFGERWSVERGGCETCPYTAHPPLPGIVEREERSMDRR